jgi:CheY-like chemotaxis protein
MLGTLGYTDVYQAIDGADAVRQVQNRAADNDAVDVVLMDLWMPYMDGYEATERILNMGKQGATPSSEGGVATSSTPKTPVVLAVTADATDAAFERARLIGMRGFMTKPYRLLDLEKLIMEHCLTEPTLDVPMIAV